MRLILHGELRKRFGPAVVMNADTVADALEGFSRQVDWPREMPVRVMGFDTPEKFKEDALEVHVVPAMIGGGGKFGSIIIGAIEVIVGVVMVVTSFGSNALGWSLIISGSIMIAQGIISLFLKAPKVKGVDDPEASKYLPINRNTTAVGTPITLAWGRIDLAGHWLSLQSDSTNLSYGVFPATPT